MALNKTNINYSGKELGYEIVKESFSNNLLHTQFGARILAGPEGGKSDVVWHNVSLDLTINEKTDCPTFNTDFGLNQNTATMCEYQVAGKISHESLVGTYRELNLQPGALVERTSQDTEVFDALVDMLIRSVNQEQGILWLTADDVACQPGLLTQFLDDTLGNPVPAANRIDAIAGAITPANVQGEIDKLIDALPAKYRYKGTVTPKIAVSAAIADAFLKSASYISPATGTSYRDPNVNEANLRYRNYEMVVIDGLGEKEMFMTYPDNIGLVMDGANDLTNLIVRDGLEDTTLCTQVAFRLDWRSAAFFGEGEAITFYSPDVTP